MKKALALLLVALISLSAVFAGGSSESADDGKTTLTWAIWDYATTPYYDALIDAYEASHPDVNVEVIDLGSADYQTALQIQLSGGGSEFDVVAVKDIPGYNNLVKAGLLADLTPLAERDGIDTSLYGGIVEQVTVDGKFYELPFRSDFWVLFYNKDLFDAAGVPYPTNDMTFEEYDALARQMTSGSGASKVYGAHYHSASLMESIRSQMEGTTATSSLTMRWRLLSRQMESCRTMQHSRRATSTTREYSTTSPLL